MAYSPEAICSRDGPLGFSPGVWQEPCLTAEMPESCQVKAESVVDSRPHDDDRQDCLWNCHMSHIQWYGSIKRKEEVGIILMVNEADK